MELTTKFSEVVTKTKEHYHKYKRRAVLTLIGAALAGVAYCGNGIAPIKAYDVNEPATATLQPFKSPTPTNTLMPGEATHTPTITPTATETGTPTPVIPTNTPTSETPIFITLVPTKTGTPTPTPTPMPPAETLCVSPDSINGAVLGGEAADIEDHPYFVSFGINCEGANINSGISHLAAHCRNYIPYQATFGSEVSDILDRDNAQFIWMQKVIPHPNYGIGEVAAYDNMLAIPAFKPIKGSNVNEIKAGTVDQLPQEGDFVCAIGKGRSEEYLKKVALPVIDFTQCNEKMSPIFGFPVPDTDFCAGGQLNHDTEPGNSGSPIIRIINGEHVLVGGTSIGWNSPPGLRDFYAGYAKVPIVDDWIKQQVSLALPDIAEVSIEAPQVIKGTPFIDVSYTFTNITSQHIMYATLFCGDHTVPENRIAAQSHRFSGNDSIQVRFNPAQSCDMQLISDVYNMENGPVGGTVQSIRHRKDISFTLPTTYNIFLPLVIK